MGLNTYTFREWDLSVSLKLRATKLAVLRRSPIFRALFVVGKSAVPHESKS